MVTISRALVAWRNSFRSAEPTLASMTFSFDPAVYALDFWPRSVIETRFTGEPLASYSVVPWEATETVQVVAKDQAAEDFEATVAAIIRNTNGRIYVTDACRIWSCHLSGAPQLSLVGASREAVLTWRGSASWEVA